MSRIQTSKPTCRLTLALGAVCCLSSALAQNSPAPDLNQPKPLQATPRDSARAEQAYLDGARLFDRKDLAGATAEFSRAVALDSRRPEYTLALDLAKQNRIGQLLAQSAAASLQQQPEQAANLIAQATALNPKDERILERAPDRQATAPEQHPTFTRNPDRNFAPPIQLQPADASQAFDLRGDVRTITTSVAQGYGIKVNFDESVKPQDLRFVLEEQPYKRSMTVLLHMAHLFATTLDPHSILIARDTQENHERLDRLVEETIFVPAATPEQLNELTQIIKSVFDVKQVVIKADTGTILLRAPEETIKAVNYTVADLVDGGAQVVLDLKLYSIDKSYTRNIGLQTPQTAGIFSVAQEARTIVNANQSAVSALISSGAYIPTGNVLNDQIAEALILIGAGIVANPGIIAIFGHGLSLFGVTETGSVSLAFGLNTSEVQALDDLSVRVGDRQTTTLRVGERYPVTTSRFSSGLSGVNASALAGVMINGVSAASLLNQVTGAAASLPLVTFEDLGITLKTTPMVLKSGLVSIQVDLKLEALQGVALNDIPVLTSSVFTSDITIADGSTALMISEMSATESSAVNGTPGLGELPGFNETIGGDRTSQHAKSELVLLVTPHIVRRRANTVASKRYVFETTVPQDF